MKLKNNSLEENCEKSQNEFIILIHEDEPIYFGFDLFRDIEFNQFILPELNELLYSNSIYPLKLTGEMCCAII